MVRRLSRPDLDELRRKLDRDRLKAALDARRNLAAAGLQSAKDRSIIRLATLYSLWLELERQIPRPVIDTTVSAARLGTIKLVTRRLPDRWRLVIVPVTGVVIDKAALLGTGWFRRQVVGEPLSPLDLGPDDLDTVATLARLVETTLERLVSHEDPAEGTLHAARVRSALKAVLDGEGDEDDALTFPASVDEASARLVALLGEEHAGVIARGFDESVRDDRPGRD
jgi:hypothetical protein